MTKPMSVKAKDIKGFLNPEKELFDPRIGERAMTLNRFKLAENIFYSTYEGYWMGATLKERQDCFIKAEAIIQLLPELLEAVK